MAAITPHEAAHLARLARLDLVPDELAHLAGQLDVILHAVARVQDAATDGVPPTSHPLPLTNVTRPDVVRPSLGAEAALAGVPAAEGDRFRVPRMLGEES